MKGNEEEMEERKDHKKEGKQKRERKRGQKRVLKNKDQTREGQLSGLIRFKNQVATGRDSRVAHKKSISSYRLVCTISFINVYSPTLIHDHNNDE